MLIPIGSDRGEVRRHPAVTYVIVAINVIAFMATAMIMSGPSDADLEAKFDEIVKVLLEHPYLVPPPEIERFFSPEDLVYLSAAASEMREKAGAPAEETRRRQSRILQQKATELQELLGEHPLFRLGYVPARPQIPKLFTSLFVHADFWHLLGNMLFLFIVSAFLEDVLGRPLFAAFYISGGLVATGFHVWQNPGSYAPLVGASGAVAAVMGGYLFRFWKSKIELLWLPIFFLPWLRARFFAPAFLIIPLWFVSDFYLAMRGAQDVGIAVWAHVGGFLFGFAVTALIGVTRLEERVLDPGITAKTTWEADRDLLAAIDARHLGRQSTAIAAADRALRRDPSNEDARRLALDLALDTGDHRSAETHALHLLDHWMRTGEDALAGDLIERLSGAQTGALPERFLTRAAAHLERKSDLRSALALYQRVATGGREPITTLKANLKVAELCLRNGDVTEAASALQKAEANPECMGEWLENVQRQRTVMGSLVR